MVQLDPVREESFNLCHRGRQGHGVAADPLHGNAGRASPACLSARADPGFNCVERATRRRYRRLDLLLREPPPVPPGMIGGVSHCAQL